MENWQKAHITANIPQLIQNTICHLTLISRLQSSNVLSIADIASLNANGNPLEKSRMLYEILQTRVGAYDILIRVLLEERQNGAAAILQTGKQPLPQQLTELTYDKTQVLGSGCQNTKVYKGKFRNEDVAVKVINCDFIDKTSALKEFERFGQLLQQHSSENIVRYYHAKAQDNFLLVAVELCACNLAECIKHNKLQISPTDVLHQTTKGLNFLHYFENGILHLDLKPENILLKMESSKSVVVKIADFGISKKLTPDDKSSVLQLPSSSGLGTIFWLAPERQKSKEKPKCLASRASDVFSLGCVFYYVLSKGEHPFGDELHCVANIADDNNQMKAAHVPEELRDYFWLIRLMINNNEIQRPTTDFILKHLLYWSSDRKLKFIFEISYLLKNNVGLSEVCLNNCTAFLKKIGSASILLSNNWLTQLCPNVHNHVATATSNILSVENPLKQLIFTISHLYEDHVRLPQLIKNSLGRLPDEFVLYWTSRFPFLMSSLWIHFEKMQKEAKLAEYYHGNFHLSYNSPAAQLALIQAFQTPGHGITYFEEQRQLRAAVRLEASPLETIEESSSLNECTTEEKISGDLSKVPLNGQTNGTHLSGSTASSSSSLNGDNGATFTEPQHQTGQTKPLKSPSLLSKLSKEGQESMEKCNGTNTEEITPLPAWKLVSIAIEQGDVAQLENACNFLAKDENRSVTEILKKIEEKTLGTVLHLAVRRGKTECVEYLLSHKGFDAALTHERMHDILHICVANTTQENDKGLADRCKIINLLVTRNRELLRERNQNEETPLHVPGIHVTLLLELIKLGGDVSVETADKRTVMHTAAESCSNGEDFHRVISSIDKKFLKTFKMTCRSGKLPLHYAVMRFEVSRETLVLLQSNGLLDLNVQDENGNSVFMQGIIGQRKSEYLSILCNEFGADKSKTDYERRSGLHLAALYGNVSALIYLVSPLTVNTLDVFGRTPLHCNFLNCHGNLMAITQHLVEHGADVNTKTTDRSGSKTPLHLILQMQTKFPQQNLSSRLWEVASFLIDNGAEPGIQDSEDNTCFHTAFENSHADLIKNILNFWTSFEAFISMRNRIGETPLHKLFKRKFNENFNFDELIGILAEKYSDFINVNIKDGQNKSVIDLVNLLNQQRHISNNMVELLKGLQV